MGNEREQKVLQETKKQNSMEKVSTSNKRLTRHTKKDREKKNEEWQARREAKEGERRREEGHILSQSIQMR
jgi:hypothetical protein